MFKVYDKVWVISNNKPAQKVVFAVVESMDQAKKSTEVYYHLVNSQVGAGWGNNEGLRRAARSVFKSRGALIESLYNATN